MMTKIILLLTTLALSITADTGKLIKIVDGDTVHFETDGKKVNCRLAYIDTPESKRNTKAKKDVSSCTGINLDDVVYAGKLSYKYLSAHLSQNNYYKYKVVGRDTRYDRSVCEIYNKNGLVNLQIVKDGYAVPYYSYIKDRSKKEVFRTHTENAKNQNLGNWRDANNVMLCMNKNNTNSIKLNENIDIEKYIRKAFYYYNKISNLF